MIPASIPEAHAVCARSHPGGPWHVVADVCDGRRAWPVYDDAGEAEAVRELFAAADPGGDYRIIPVGVRFVAKVSAVAEPNTCRLHARPRKSPRVLSSESWRLLGSRAAAGERRRALAAEFGVSVATVKRAKREALAV